MTASANTVAFAVAAFVGAIVRIRKNARCHDGRDSCRVIRSRMSSLNNVYVVVRHGQSKANVAELIVSDPAIGISQYGLTDNGKQQANVAGDLLVHSLTELSRKGSIAGDCRKVTVLTSDFSRARETAEIVSERLAHAGIAIPRDGNGNASVILKPELRERFFGTLEGKSSDYYKEVWKHDVVSVHHTHQESESIASVLTRTTKLIMDTEAALQGHVVLLVAHGDVNQILRSAFRTHLTPSQHRSDEHLNPASARALNCEALNELLSTK
jgi:broad specificity phosphatase PhoE